MKRSSSFTQYVVPLWWIAIVWLVLPAPPAQALQSREDTVDGRWLQGNLTWADGRGGIVWGPAKATELAGHKDASADEFVSETLSAPVYVNPAHLVQLDLKVKKEKDLTGAEKNPPCESGLLTVRLRVDGTVVGGADQANQLSQDVRAAWPSDPPGFYTCRYRFPLEVFRLPKGAVVEIRIEDREVAFHLGVSPETASSIRIPTFSPEEAVYRFPSIIPRSHPSTGGGELPALVGIGGLTTLVGLKAPRRRAFIAVALLLLAGLMAGCAGRPPAAASHPLAGPTASFSVTTHEAGDTGLANASTGSIVGQVHDPYYLPVAGAAVAVVGEPWFAETDASGLFSLKGLRPATYNLRIDAEFYRSAEISVPVLAERITQVDVELPYDDSIGSANRPHRHDYWGGEEAKTVLVETLPTRCTGPACKSAAMFFVTADGSADHNTIRPGTEEVELTLKFDEAEAWPGGIGLWFQDNVEPSPMNWSYLVPRPSGVPFRIRAAWETTDVGHQLFSTWRFQLYGVANDATIEATMRIKRGSIPLEPPHPDHWGAAGRKKLGPPIEQTTIYAAPPIGTVFTPIVVALCAAQGGWGRVNLGIPGAVVPVGAGTLDVYVNQSRPNGGVGAVPTYGWALWFKNGEAAPQNYVEGSPLFRQAGAATVSADGRNWKWSVKLEPRDADGIYNRKSAWTMTLVADNLQAYCLDMFVGMNTTPVDAGIAALGPITYRWENVAVRAPDG